MATGLDPRNLARGRQRHQASCMSLKLFIVGGLLSAGIAIPAFVIEAPAKPVLRSLWSTSLITRREQVACLGGEIRGDTVRVTHALALPDTEGDSLSASAESSLEACAAPEWIGTVHTHIRATDGAEPPPRFSPGDRAVMSAWSARWARPGAFCVLYSEKGAHCEVYPPR